MHGRALLFVAVLAAALLPRQAARGGELTFTSKMSQTHLLELFTSEGCSSCPPAEVWLGKLKNDEQLWKDFVPIAFHVDYWDGLGWKDRFAQAEWTQRQRAHSSRWGASSVYTPGFVLDGEELRNWAGKLSFHAKENAGLLEATMNGDSVTVGFRPGPNFNTGSAHVAWLGFDLISSVRAGENAGRSLRHDFVVLRHSEAPLVRDANGFWKTDLTSSADHGEGGALACWIESGGVPVQATGGWLSATVKKQEAKENRK